jgi:hypothetical protein
MNSVLRTAQVSLCHVTEPSEHSVSNHRLPSRRILWVACGGLTVPPSWLPPPEGRCVIWASPLTGGLATTVGRIKFTCVTDCSFTSGCSPPRLAAAQLPSVTECQNTLAGTRTLLIRCTYRRTGRPSGAAIDPRPMGLACITLPTRESRPDMQVVQATRGRAVNHPVTWLRLSVLLPADG